MWTSRKGTVWRQSFNFCLLVKFVFILFFFQASIFSFKPLSTSPLQLGPVIKTKLNTRRMNNMEEMKVILRWEGTQFWMNPDNLLIALGIACPNTKFECEYLIHPNADEKRKEFIRMKYEIKDNKLDKKCLKWSRKYNKLLKKKEEK
jgi:hypothetical protein